MDWPEIFKKNDIAFWFPTLRATGVPVPGTYIIEDVDEEVLYKMFDSASYAPSEFRELVERIGRFADALGYPVFLRSGQTSVKHSWKDSCYLERSEDISKHVFEIMEFSACQMPDLPFNTWAVRQFIPMDTAFVAFWGNTPINRERRYFIHDGRVLCHHPYWPKEAFDPERLVGGWEQALEELNRESDEEVAHLTAQSENVSRAFEGAWSLDWCKGKDGVWYATDMGVAESSWHWSGCPVAADFGR